VIILDTTVLVYAVGAEHALKDPSLRLLDAVSSGRAPATTTIEVIQEFAHVRARRGRPRADAVEHARKYMRMLSPLLSPDDDVLQRGLDLFTKHQLGCFDAVLAATALREDAALVSADRTFADVDGLRYLDPASPAFFADLGLV
jgi:uncharacterized protein